MRRRDLMLGGFLAFTISPRLASAAASAVPLVVVELFTSQGCSSCPPADALLSELAQQSDVVALAWHVDYWNRLGWRDPYASPEWTQRQRRYATLLHADVYTPALVVNGRRVVVGSNRSAVRAAISEPRALSVYTELKRSATGLSAWLGPRPDGATVTLIVYDPVHATSVGAGENAGRTLREAHIVRAVLPIDVDAGDVAFSHPGIQPDQGAVLLVQDHNWVVLGVAQVRAATEALP